MSTANTFLTTYKEYESLLREAGAEPREVEAALEAKDPSKCARLRMCRQFRNYLAHEHDPGFLEPTQKMQIFLENEVMTLKMSGDVCKKHLRSPAAAVWTPSAKCADVLTRLAVTKQEIAVCRDETRYTLYSIYDISAAVLESKTKKMRDVKPIREKPNFASPAEPMENIDRERVTICTSDGTPSGELLGVVKTN